MFDFIKRLFAKKEARLAPIENIQVLIRLAEFACRTERDAEEMIKPMEQAVKMACRFGFITEDDCEILMGELEIARDIERGSDKKTKYLGFVAWSKVRNFLLKKCL